MTTQKKKKPTVKDIKNALTVKTKREDNKRTPQNLLSSGSTLLNLACTDSALGYTVKGKYVFIVGDSSAGKTFLALTCLAEASVNPAFENYRLIYDNIEDGALMDMEKYFGKKVARRLEPPSIDKGAAVYSETVQDFYYHVDDALEEAQQPDGRPFIYMLDSQDSLTSEAEQDKFDEQKKASRAGKETAGSYGDGKAKAHSEGLRKLMGPLSKTGSILIIISQTRDNLGFGFEKKTRSGGKALRFYAALEIWLSLKGKIEKTVKGKKRQIGVRSIVQIKKNRYTGKQREIEIPIYHSHGIDDVGACVDYLISEGEFRKKGKSTILVDDWEFEGSRESLIRYIEDEELEQDLYDLLEEYWNEVEAGCAIKRKKRYE